MSGVFCLALQPLTIHYTINYTGGNMNKPSSEIQEVMDKFQQLFHAPPKSPRDHSRGCGTNSINFVINGIRIHWHELPNTFRKEAEECLYIDDSDPKNVIVSLIGPQD